MARILIIDDDETVLQSLGLLLRTEGHTVIPVKESSVGAEEIKNGQFDLMITDIRMPPPDGMELLRLAHELKPGTPTIVVSAFCSDSTIQQGYQLGCKSYVRKPFKIQEVLEAVHKALGSGNEPA